MIAAAIRVMGRTTLHLGKSLRYRAVDVVDQGRTIVAGYEVSPELLERTRGTLDGGVKGLEGIADAPAPGIDAGESTPTVAETLGALLEASAGVLAGVQEMAGDVQATRDQYLNDDDAAAELFGRPGQ